MQGSVRQIERGGRTRWEVRVDLGVGEDGRRRQRSKTCETRKEAERYRREWLRQIERGEAVERAPDTVAQLLTDYLASRRHDLRPNSYRIYESAVRLYLVPALGHLTVQALTARHVERLLGSLRDRGLSASTTASARAVLGQACTYAVRDGLIARNPVTGTRQPRAERREMQTWSVEEAQCFLQVAATHGGHGPIWALALTTGLRLGELLGLRWRDLDLEAGQLTIRQAMVIAPDHTGRRRPTFGPPKSRSGRRPIPLAPELVALLRAHRAQQAAARLLLGPQWTAGDLVFAGQSGAPWQPQTARRECHRLMRLASVPRLRIHDQRHTFATHALADGAAIPDVSALLGHSRTSITLDVYAHAASERQATITQRSAARLLGHEEVDQGAV